MRARGTPVGNAEAPGLGSRGPALQILLHLTAGASHTCMQAHLQPYTRASVGALQRPRAALHPPSQGSLSTLVSQGDSHSPCPATPCSLGIPRDAGCSSWPPTHRTDPPGPPLSSPCLFTGLLGHWHRPHRVPQRLAGVGHDRHSANISWVYK